MDEIKEIYSHTKTVLKKQKSINSALQKLHILKEQDDKDLTNLQKIINAVRLLPIDAKVEIILADLDEEMIDKLVVMPIGLFHRNYHKDVELAQESEFENHLLQFKINREGIYDALPEALIHQPSKPKKGAKDKDEILSEIRTQNEREKATRKFFLPIEQEIYRAKIALELEEVKYFINQRNIKEHSVFQKFWEIPDFLNHQQICNMVFLLPIAHRIVGDFRLTELCFESILKDRIGIKNIYPLSHQVPPIFNDETQQEEEVGVALGIGELGKDFILNSTHYQETIPAILINIGPIETEAVKEYAKSTVSGILDGKNREVLDYLIKNFLPFDADIHINIDVKETEGYYFCMSDNETTSNAILGINSRL